ncbi:hypothetical protein EalM132_00155 [Exiguobacterium phage vB_EalM-132]|nr:hypothetical protein EalM132_00155 [Exiguobacterium phage vB_EalM-132]
MNPYDVIRDFIESFSPLLAMFTILSLPVLAYLSYHVVKETIVSVQKFRQIRKFGKVEYEYGRYVVVALELKKYPSIIGVVEDGAVIPIKCYEEDVDEMLRGLVRLNPGKAPIIDACIDPERFNLIHVRGYSLIDNAEVDKMLEGNKKDSIQEAQAKHEIERRVFKESWRS